MERYLHRTLKNWASKHNPPENLRGRLILIASAQSYPLEEPAQTHRLHQYTNPPKIYHLDAADPAKIYDLVLVFQLPMPALRQV